MTYSFGGRERQALYALKAGTAKDVKTAGGHSMGEATDVEAD